MSESRLLREFAATGGALTATHTVFPSAWHVVDASFATFRLAGAASGRRVADVVDIRRFLEFDAYTLRIARERSATDHAVS